MTTAYEEKPGEDSTGKGRVVPAGGRGERRQAEPAPTVFDGATRRVFAQAAPLVKKDPDPKAGETAAKEHNATEGEGFTDSVTGERITLAVLLAAWE